MNSLINASALVRAASATNNNHAFHPPRATIGCIQELIASNLQTAHPIRKFANAFLAVVAGVRAGERRPILLNTPQAGPFATPSSRGERENFWWLYPDSPERTAGRSPPPLPQP